MGYNMKRGNSGVKFKSLGSEKKYTKVRSDLKMKPPYKKPVGPRATKKNIKEETHNEAAARTEGPEKLQTVRRKGSTPNSQKFSKIAKKNVGKKKVDPDAPGTPGKPGYEPPVKRSDLDAKGKAIWDKHRENK